MQYTILFVECNIWFKHNYNERLLHHKQCVLAWRTSRFFFSISIVERGLGSDSGIECQWGDWIVTGNHVYNVTEFGILIHNTTPPTRSVVIANNIVRDCDFMGIAVIEAVSHFIIKGNISYDDRVTPLQGQPLASDHYVITNNICYLLHRFKILVLELIR